MLANFQNQIHQLCLSFVCKCLSFVCKCTRYEARYEQSGVVASSPEMPSIETDGFVSAGTSITTGRHSEIL